MRIIDTEPKLDFDDVLFVPQRSTINSRADVQLDREFIGYHSKKTFTCFPIVVTNMLGVGSFSMAQALRYRACTPLVCLNKYYDEKMLSNFMESCVCRNYVYSMGIQEKDFDKLSRLAAHLKWLPDFVLIDTPNGYMERVADFVKRVRDFSPNSYIIAGNICTPSVAENLSIAGADCLRVGIGTGQQCRSRLVAAVGYPQFSAISEVANVCHGIGTHVMADGGITHIGDFSKAFGAGADFVCAGSIFAGYDEGEYEWLEDENGKYTEFFGLSSNKAQEKIYGKLESHRASEGRVTKIYSKGSIHDLFREIEGGIRSTCSYIGARRIKDMPKCATFVRVNRTHNNSMDHYTIGN